MSLSTHRFMVFLQNRSVGTTDLEYLDEGMGVGYGRFHPLQAYDTIREHVIRAAEARHNGAADSGPQLELRSGSGERMVMGFVVIEDFGNALVEVELEIAAQLVDRKQYERVVFGGLTFR